MSYVYVEQILLAMLEFVPGIYIISMGLKLKFLSTNNAWHQALYDKTFGHLQEFDIFHMAWHHSSDKIVSLAVKLIELLDYLYPRLTADQLDVLSEAMDEAASRVRLEKNSKESRKTMRMSRLLNRSTLEQFEKGKLNSTSAEDAKKDNGAGKAAGKHNN